MSPQKVQPFSSLPSDEAQHQSKFKFLTENLWQPIIITAVSIVIVVIFLPVWNPIITTLMKTIELFPCLSKSARRTLALEGKTPAWLENRTPFLLESKRIKVFAPTRRHGFGGKIARQMMDFVCPSTINTRAANTREFGSYVGRLGSRIHAVGNRTLI